MQNKKNNWMQGLMGGAKKTSSTVSDNDLMDNESDWEEVSVNIQYSNQNDDTEMWEEVDEDDEWEEISPPTKKIHTARSQPAPKEAVSIVKIDADHCCICGRELDAGSTRLNGLQSGREAWIDSSCLKKLLAMAQSNDQAEFEIAVRYMKSRVSVVDPDVGISLQKFISKSEDRIRGNY